MDPARLDAITRSVAIGGTRRGILRALGLGGVIVASGTVAARQPSAALAQSSDDPVTCSWYIEAEGSSDSNSGDTYNGILEVTIKPNGVIEDGTYTLVDEDWEPLLDDNGDEIVYQVTGSANQHTLGFRAERDGCDELSFNGVGRSKIRTCQGPMSGTFQGPDLPDTGGWRTYRKAGCGPCNGLICPWGEFVDPDECDCVETCPNGYEECQGVICAPTDCDNGGSYDPDTCTCGDGCEPEDCDSGEKWSPSKCKCVKDSCTEQQCNSPYVWSKSDCACVCQQSQCDSGYVWDWNSCSCVPESCPEQPCDSEYVWSPESCSCVCGLQSCDNNYWLDTTTCTCLDCDEQYQCEPGYSWDTHTCKCRYNCEGVDDDCTYGGQTGAFYFNTETCECECYDPSSTRCGLTCGLAGCICDQASSTCQCAQGYEPCGNSCVPVCTGNTTRDQSTCQCV